MMTTPSPQGPKRSVVKQAIFFVFGFIAAVILNFILGLLLTSIAGTKEITPRRSPIAVGVFGAIGVAAVAVFIQLLRSKRSRPFVLGGVIALGVTALIEGLCFLG